MSNSKCTIFFSWQSDISKCRSFISSALKMIKPKDLEIDSIQVDRDTAGLPGSPNIADAVFAKIQECDVFVADVTIVNKDAKGRLMPNPNVLIELGYAIAAKGWERIVLLNCTDYGYTEQLPFDINHLRITSFTLEGERKNEDKKRVRDNVSETIRLLRDNGELDRENRELTQIRQKTAKAVLRALDRALRGEAVIIRNNFLDEFEKLEDSLENFEELHQLVSDIIAASQDNGEGEHTFGEIFEEYVEELYLNFRSALGDLPFIEVANEKFVNLYNSLLPKDAAKKIHKTRREVDGTVFDTAPESIEVQGKDGKVYCKGNYNSEGLFTGYMIVHDSACIYDGHYLNGEKHGEGIMYESDVYEDRPSYPLMKGEWEHNSLKNGYLFNVFIESDGEVSPEALEFDYISARRIYGNITHGFPMDHEGVKYITADICFKDGVGRVDLTDSQYLDDIMDDDLDQVATDRLKRHNLTPMMLNGYGSSEHILDDDYIRDLKEEYDL